MKLKATLRLENGMEFHGWSFGSAQAVSGEVVFNTSMVGYPEQLTDPTYSGQILCLTYPLIGNYGVPSEELAGELLSKNFESEKIQPKGQPLKSSIKCSLLQFISTVGQVAEGTVDAVAVAVFLQEGRQDNGIGMTPYQISRDGHRLTSFSHICV